MTRTDVHRPSAFDPADYRVVDYIDNKRPDPPTRGGREAWEAYERFVAAWQAQIFEHFPEWRTGGGDHRSIFECNHCGHPGIRYVAVVEHVPTGARLAFGEICADRTELAGRDEFKKKFARDRAAEALRRVEREIAEAAFKAEHPDAVAFLQEWKQNDDAPRTFGITGGALAFLDDLASSYARKGELSEKQVAAVEKFAASAREREARREDERAALADVPPLPEGRLDIEGEIVSEKWTEDDYGTHHKMLVKLDNGNKVWGTIPRTLEDAVKPTYYYDAAGNNAEIPAQIAALRGARVRFTATVERSKKDDHFGFFKRPSKASVVPKEAA